MTSGFSSELRTLSPRDFQRYASKLLRAYCEAKSIRHEAIDELTAHLDSFPDGGGLAVWEKKGALLPLNGRGDDMPSDLEQSIPSQVIDDFRRVIDCAVEVGIVDIYGAPTDSPVKFIEKISSIVRKNDIDFPQL
jgi:hypothetical protein